MSDALEDSKRETFHLHIGSGGIEVGNRCWQLYSLEHSLEQNGCLQVEATSNLPPVSFFNERHSGDTKIYRPRALFIDHDSSAIDQIKTGAMRNFYEDTQFLVQSDCSDLVIDRIRQSIETCDHFQGFIVSHALNGSCSKDSTNLLMHLKNEYSEKTILTNSIVGSSIDACDMFRLLNYSDVVIPMENKGLFKICHSQLNIEHATYAHVNRLMAACWNLVTCSMRLDGCLLPNLNDFKNVLVPFPSLKLITPHLSPLIPYSHSLDPNFQSPSVYDMCIPSLPQSTTSFIECETPHKMFLALVMLFRGEKIVPKEVGQKLICEMKRTMRFADSIPTGFKCGLDYNRSYVFQDQYDMAPTDKQVLMLSNRTRTSRYLCHLASDRHGRSSNDEEKTEVIEAHNYLKQLTDNYEEFEKEIHDEIPSE